MCVRLILVFLFLLLISCSNPAGHSVSDEIKSRNSDLERAFIAGETDMLVSIYDDQACLIPRQWRVACGKDEIHDYWARITWPVDWKLSAIVVSADESDLYQSPYYQELEVKPRHWSELDILVPDSVETMYEFGHSLLKYQLGDGTIHECHVDFILVWIKIDGEWKIMVDTYV